jgi:hypothetical protein
MKNVAPAILLLFVSCSTAPKYAKSVTNEDGTVVIRLESMGDVTAATMRAALYTEAARETIDRGLIYLRVGDVSTNASIDIDSARQTNRPSSRPSPVPGDRDAEIILSGHRKGLIRFQPFRERPADGQVFEAARLIDQIRAGTVP